MNKEKNTLEKSIKPTSKTKFDNLSTALKENLRRRKKIRQKCEEEQK